MTMRFTSRWVLALMCVICLHGAAQSQQQVLDSASVDIGVGADGTVWVIAGDPASGNVINNNKLTTLTTRRVGISRREKDGNWTLVAEMPHPPGAGGAWRIAVDPSGNAWIVTSTQQIFRYDGSGFKPVVAALKPRDIGIGADGTIWTTSEQEGARVSTDKGESWKNNDSGKATNVAVENPGTIAWLVNSIKALYHWNGSTWLRIPNLTNGVGFTDVGVGGNNVVWVVSNAPIQGTHDFLLYSSTDSGKNWKGPYRGGLRVAVAPDGSAFVVDSAGKVTQVYPAGDPIVIGVTGFSIPVGQPNEVPEAPCKDGAQLNPDGSWGQIAQDQTQDPTKGTLVTCYYDGPPIVVCGPGPCPKP
jgi:hypothetical protein